MISSSIHHCAIEPDFNSIVTKWYGEYKGLLNIYIPYFHGLSNDLNLSDTYLNICRAIEALGRHCGAPIVKKPKSNDKSSQLVNAIVYLYDQYRDSMDKLIPIKFRTRFARKIDRYRNNLAHADPIISKHDKSFQKTYDLIEQLRVFLTIALLRYHGVTTEVINQGLNSSFVYSHLRMKKKEAKH